MAQILRSIKNFKKNKENKESKESKEVQESQKKLKAKNDAKLGTASVMSVIQKPEDPSSKQSAIGASCRRSMGAVFNQAKWAQIRPFVAHIFHLGIKGLTAEFLSKKRKINSRDDVEKMKEFNRQNPAGRNRYRDVGCLDVSRVKVSGLVGGHDYVHANYVSTPKSNKRFICTQAPLNGTISDFWQLVVQEKSEYILMLCNLTEKGLSKCAIYWPQFNQSCEFGDVRVLCTSAGLWKPSTNVTLVRNTLVVTIKGRPPHRCTQLRWMDWPDRGVPEADMAPCAVLKEIEFSSTPIVVHCSAGVGRTACIVLIQTVIEMVESGASITDCAVLLEQLRAQRHNSVQTEHQYLYIHRVLLLYFQKQGYLDMAAIANDLQAFEQEYETAIKR